MRKENESITLEGILQKYFDCKKPFLKRKRLVSVEGGYKRYEYMTQEGIKAYEKLIDFLYDCNSLGIGIDANMAIKILDQIVDEDEY